MAAAVRRFVEAFRLLPKRQCLLGQLASLGFHRPMMTNNFINPSINPKDGTVMDSSEFLNWHNGGGLFHQSASIDPTVLIEIGAIVHANTVLGTDIQIGSGTIIGPSVSIGQSTKVGYNSVLSNCCIGISCRIHNGVCIGQDGFGFFVDEEGHVQKKPQMLHVKIGDHVEIGSNTCIDRGSLAAFPVYEDHSSASSDVLHDINYSSLVISKDHWTDNRDKYGFDSDSSLDKERASRHSLHQHLRQWIEEHYKKILLGSMDKIKSWRDTVIGDYTKIDNLVQIGHNVVIGKCCMICGQAGLAGSVSMGDYVTLGGRVAVRDHVSIASKVRLAGNSCVTKDIMEPGDYGGFPAVPAREWRRQAAKMRRFCKDVPQE